MSAAYTQMLEELALIPPKEGSDSIVTPEYFEERDGLTRRFKVKYGVAEIRGGQSSTYTLSELLAEWPELIEIVEKVSRGEKLTEEDESWINELAEVTGWDRNTIIDELANVDVDPSKRAEKYRKLHEEYFNYAKEFKEKGDTRQAGEKLWGAVTALIKLYSAIKGVPVAHWSMGKLERFVTYNVEEKYKALFRDLLDKARVLHEHFYEAHLDNKTFEERWEETIKLLERAREHVQSLHQL